MISPLPRSGLLRARRILTLDPGITGDAVLWTAGRIQAVGEFRRLSALTRREIPVFDLPDTLVTAGFTDSHTHFAMWALGRGQVLLAGTPSRAAAVRKVANAAMVQGWILGQGWDANSWEEPP